MNFKKTFCCLLASLIFNVMIDKVECLGGPKGFYSNEWLLKSKGGRLRAKAFAENQGFEIIKEVEENEHFIDDIFIILNIEECIFNFFRKSYTFVFVKGL